MKYQIRRILNKILGKMLFSFYPKVIKERHLGQTILSDLSTDIGRHFFFFGHFEESELKHIRDLIKEDSVIIDVGANIGLHSIFFSKIAFNGRIFALEPGRSTFQRLVENVFPNKNILPINVALANEIQWKKFFEASDNAYSGLKDTLRKPIVKTYDVFCTTIDSLVNFYNLENLDFVKIDVEGTETDVIKGMQNTIRRFRPTIMCEIYKGANSNLYPEETIEFLMNNGYKAKNFINKSLVDYTEYDERYYNFIFIPEKKII